MEGTMGQTLFNIAVGLGGFLGGFLLKIIWDAIKELRETVGELEVRLPEAYVKKDDFQHFSDAIFRKLDKIEDKIDNKVDK